MTDDVRACDGPHCITCSDSAVVMRIERVVDEATLAVCVDETGTRHEVLIALVPDAKAGSCVLVHAGTALQEQPR